MNISGKGMAATPSSTSSADIQKSIDRVQPPFGLLGTSYARGATPDCPAIMPSVDADKRCLPLAGALSSHASRVCENVIWPLFEPDT
jgi:hypothetical protein